MAIEDEAAGRWGVQFHPESILTASGGAGHQVIANVLRLCRARAGGRPASVAACAPPAARSMAAARPDAAPGRQSP
jgi:hypothetical protein